MLKLHENETILLVIHKHWFVMARTVIALAIFIVIPIIAYALVPLLAGELGIAGIERVLNFFLALYSMALLLFLFLAWMDYYLDMWIVTTARIIDVEQYGLFSREVSEVPLERIQDVTIEVHGIIETLLRFGTVRIQTAGEREFIIHSVPHLYEIKDAILKHARSQRNGVR